MKTVVKFAAELSRCVAAAIDAGKEVELFSVNKVGPEGCAKYSVNLKLRDVAGVLYTLGDELDELAKSDPKGWPRP